MGAALAMAGGAAVAAEPAARATIEIRADAPGPVIDPEIYGQFAEHLGGGIYGGVWVGEDSKIPNIRGYRRDVVEALKALHVPLVRWPGGCYAEEYHWREGIGPRAARKVRVNNSWGGTEESNQFGTHEFMDFAELIGAKAYINANLGAGTPQEMVDWIEYMTSSSRSALAQERRANGRDKPWSVDWIAIGNESWGCGGTMRSEYYADLYRQWSTFVRPPGDRPVRKLAVGPSGDDYAWTETVMKSAGKMMDALSLHYYTLPTGDWAKKGDAVAFGEAEWAATFKQTLKMEELVTRHSAIMDKYDPDKKVALAVDEWGTWYDTAPGAPALNQQNSLRDALVAAINLNIFHAHADRVRMTNIAQMVNVLQAMVLTDGDKMVLTPTYHVYALYRPFQGATAEPIKVTAPDYRQGEVTLPGVHASAARDKAGVLHVALVNLDPKQPVTVSAAVAGLAARKVSGQVLTAPAINSINTFQTPHVVEPKAFDGARLASGGFTATLPSRSVVVLDLVP
ncbi:MAG: alpha-N-arabinofuranosidase [Caulobacter sp.]|nr:alpha-N-arabinofuranosidase [Caulobacter sp.]